MSGVFGSFSHIFVLVIIVVGFGVIFGFKLMDLRCYSHYKEVRIIIEDPLFWLTVCFFFFLCFYCSLCFILYSCFYVLCILIMFKGILLFIVYFPLESFIYMLCISVIFIHITHWFCTVIIFLSMSCNMESLNSGLL